MLGFEGYAEDAGSINGDLERFRSDKDRAIGMNKQLKEQAEQLFTTKNIENVAQNFGIVGATKALDTYGNKAYEYKFSDKYAEKFGARSLKELDQKLGRKMGLSWKKGLKAKAKGGEVKPSRKAPSLNEEVGKSGRQSGQRVTDPEGEGEEDNLASFIEKQKQKYGSVEEEQPEEEQSSFRDQSEEKYPDEDEEEEEPQQASREYDDDELEQRFQQGEDMAEQDAADSTVNSSSSASGELGGEGAEAAAEGAGDVVGDVAAGAADAVTGVAEGAAAAAGGVADAVSGGLEAAGTALDATGVLAPIGFLLNIGGLFATAFGVYEAADTIVKEIRGPTKDAIPSVPVPNQPKTMAQKGLLVTPHFNSLDTYGSVSSAW
jgi:hypothetical protein